MELEGGIRVTIGERRKDQPFRVCVHNVGDQCAEVWTNEPTEAVDAFNMVTKRTLREGKKVVR